ncbi:unnamed protein product [Allacma fusca]|uniref:Uncharacterized protein n=1 Tax=Allacma fusca TaxID=39272 RepID=A0A8J2M965_9HEXA|nr:unnamed protein product [Allacma fusca]
MNKLVIVFVALCGMAVLGMRMHKKISWDDNEEIMERSKGALRCENGDFTGMHLIMENFLPIVLECQTHIEFSNVNKMSLCFMEKLGLVDSDGAPNVNKMDAFIENIFSDTILQDLPTFPQEVHICAEEFEMNYNGILKETQEESTTTFLACIKSTATKYHDVIQEVCQYEMKFNGDTTEH